MTRKNSGPSDLNSHAPSPSLRDRLVRLLGDAIHFFSYHLILRRRTTWTTRAAGMQFKVRPTVFHPRYFISSQRFAEFIAALDLAGKQVIDVGTGAGILAIAAARAGAAGVIATDINPNATLSVSENARLNAVGGRVSAVCMDLLSGLAATPSFDMIVANLPKHTQVPRDVADRGWTGGPDHRDITALFEQAYARLKPDGQLYVMMSSHSNLGVIENAIKRAGFRFRIAKSFPIFIDAFVLYECIRQDGQGFIGPPAQS